MACKKNPLDRPIALYMLFRLHRMLQMQAEYGEGLPTTKKKLLLHAINATYRDLVDLGHKKSALWYIKRKHNTLIFLVRKRRGIHALKKLEGAARAYIAVRQTLPEITVSQDFSSLTPLLATLEKCWKEAVRLGFEKEATRKLLQLGFSPKVFFPKS